MIKNTKIDWCDGTVNPVCGCPRNCEYCYARKINKRFKYVTDFSKPEFFPRRLEALNSKIPKSIFMDSMSDISFWHKTTPEAATQTFKAIIKNPQHDYIFLTKHPDSRQMFAPLEVGSGRQVIFNGFSADTQNQIDICRGDFDFYSIEPLLEPIRLPFNPPPRLKLLIIGAETGNRIGKVIPHKDWVTSLVGYARARGIRVFMKDSLRLIMGDEFIQDPLLWAVNKNNQGGI